MAPIRSTPLAKHSKSCLPYTKDVFGQLRSASAVLLVLLATSTFATAETETSKQRQIGSLSDPVNRLNELDARRADKEFLITSDPLKAYRQSLDN